MVIGQANVNSDDKRRVFLIINQQYKLVTVTKNDRLYLLFFSLLFLYFTLSITQ